VTGQVRGALLAIDTSSAISVAVLGPATQGERDVLARESVFEPRGHAELLAGLVRSALAHARVEQPDAVVVGTGPAPFTGLRVGLITARTLAHAWRVPVAGVCSLDGIGAALLGDCTVIADARRREVYWATYVGGVRVDGPQVSPPADVPVSGPVVGRGALLYPDAFPGALEGDPDPALLAAVADAASAAGKALPTEPLYLRRPDVHGVAP
jgi:tRNA threonylcarbamoyladenosine biosynthesis protein TsaB